jgi:hypothetical protein
MESQVATADHLTWWRQAVLPRRAVDTCGLACKRPLELCLSSTKYCLTHLGHGAVCKLAESEGEPGRNCARSRRVNSVAAAALYTQWQTGLGSQTTIAALLMRGGGRQFGRHQTEPTIQAPGSVNKCPEAAVCAQTAAGQTAAHAAAGCDRKRTV